jgi:hypothetical protein
VSGCGHTDAQHDAWRRDEALWQSLPLDGYQPADDGGPDYELRTLPCGSTLNRACSLTDEERTAAHAANRARAEATAAMVASIKSRLSDWDDEPTKVDAMARAPMRTLVFG